jgi:uncharacterized DUF497 family protein
MKSIHWGTWNTEHIADHGVSREVVEAVLSSPDFEAIETEFAARYVGEGTFEDRLYRVIYMETQEGIYPISAFKVRKRRIP